MRHHVFSALFALFFAFQPICAFAIDTESSREAVVSARTKKFYKSSSVRQYLSFGGSVDSDQDSKNYDFNSRYLYQSEKFINEADFQHESNYGNLGTSAGKTHLVKKSELYDLSLESKMRLGESNNYGVFYHRTIYDDMSKYYYDNRTAAGLGRMFMKEKVEFDLSLGYHDVKAYGNSMSVIPSFRLNLKLTDKLTFTERAYLFIDHESMDNELKTSLVYRLSPKVSFEIRHTYEQRRYEDDKKRIQENNVRKLITIGLIFDLE